jgi:formylglycine-generating enzyme required for sulfatase activity
MLSIKKIETYIMKNVAIIIFALLLSSCSFSWLTFKDSKDNGLENELSNLNEAEDGMVYIPGGSFNMGSKRKNEGPIKKVYIESFFMDKMEVTVADFAKFVKARKRKMPRQPDWNFDDHPVVNITWDDANDYARWIGKRLPTEAEWEYVARGGEANYNFVYENSGTYGKNYENVADESMKRFKYHFPVVDGYDDGFVYTAPVGLFAPNIFGLFDLNGNVLEWCSDWYSERFTDEDKNPKGPEKGTYKVIRGASWNRSGHYMRATYRTFYNLDVRFDFLGFRCAKDASPPITQNVN